MTRCFAVVTLCALAGLGIASTAAAQSNSTQSKLEVLSRQGDYYWIVETAPDGSRKGGWVNVQVPLDRIDRNALQPIPPQGAVQAAPPVTAISAPHIDAPVSPSFAETNVAPVRQASASKGCLAVKDAGSHAFRNIMLGGLAGALVSKKQYQIVDVVDYPAKIGQKFHGNDLQTLQSGGTRVVILDKKYTPDDLHSACK
jgi:hypothetical protein